MPPETREQQRFRVGLKEFEEIISSLLNSPKAWVQFRQPYDCRERGYEQLEPTSPEQMQTTVDCSQSSTSERNLEETSQRMDASRVFLVASVPCINRCPFDSISIRDTKPQKPSSPNPRALVLLSHTPIALPSLTVQPSVSFDTKTFQTEPF